MKNINLHPDTIAEVKDRVDLVEIISDYVVLQKKGREFVGLCPFHDEKTPSFTVNSAKQLYYCFGCGEGGGAIKFLMEIGKQSFREVVLNLAQRYQIPIKTLAPEYQQEIQKQISTREQLYEILAVANSFYQHSLSQPEGEFALKYLQETRQLNKEHIEQFKLGYAPKGWETIYHYLVELKHYSVILVEQAGLIKKRNKGDGYIDYFRDRLMIPIHDKEGRIIAFGARSLDEQQNPKYLNSPDTDLFAKNKTLFCLDLAKQTISKQDQVIIVEGYFDAIALHIAGITNTVAVLGTALTENHIKQLSRFTESKQIIINFDGDKAGLKATERAIKEVENLIYSGQLQLKILTIQDGKDADEFLHSQPNTKEKYQELVNQAPLWLDWQIEQILGKRNLQQSTDYQLAFQSIVSLIGKITKTSTRDYYLSHCAELLCTGRNKLGNLNNQELNKVYQSLQFAIKRLSYEDYSHYQKSNSSKKFLPQSTDNLQVEQAEFLLLLIYLHYPSFRQVISDSLDEDDLVFTIKNYRFLWQQIHSIFPESILSQDSSDFLLETLQENMINHPQIAKQLTNLFNPNENQRQKLVNPQQQIKNAIACLKTVKLEKYVQYCQQQILDFEKLNDVDKISFYYQELMTTKKEISELEIIRQA